MVLDIVDFLGLRLMMWMTLNVHMTNCGPVWVQDETD